MADTQHLHDVLVNLRRIIRATDLQSKRVVKACGLTIPQIMVLQAIEELGDVTVRKISDNVSLSQATVTTILNRLEDKKLVERVRAQKDKRIVNARLTEVGQSTLGNTPPLLHEKFINEFNALERWEQTQMLSTLQRIALMMDAEKLDAAPLLDIDSPNLSI
ncbi:MarR family winged helix-turn-helix transcriptional regulator [Marinomonas mediterranea]|jgi:transcriptional regulator, MarR family|uniref:Regulatory protein MarR n=1 Tax=Marinomonas mediterranea (strain ATCC 700492 / JCM 21426 / NBRC 103028 / MMB-1) TaxID=717774 RepID=F2JTA8_MARM1|nr:MarR family transcriptional regulator [Marinomonas mediterranea]ADZ90326.1 regulatory protein MarR [Marinomonas mediterranea MMB-1]WCN08385.1 MarR family transcriptional regulator [Marinomonas mediterranea]WCN12441.1 MarR family transcriptional regulator [Marinomonas mediterranea]WCN16514.1 MarR family transcriptional regulator [Marinomonas mediterranea MMB-1]